MTTTGNESCLAIVLYVEEGFRELTPLEMLFVKEPLTSEEIRGAVAEGAKRRADFGKAPVPGSNRDIFFRC